MEKLIDYTEQYIHIQASYDGGNHYSWEDAYSDLSKLVNKIEDLYRHGRTSKVRMLAKCLFKEVREEANRIRNLIYHDREN